MRLKPPKKRAKRPLLSVRGRSSSAESAGARLSALNAEIRTEIAIVTANCLFSRPWMPPRNATGRKTDDRMSAIALILSSVFLPVAFLGGIQGRLNKQFAVTIAISVLISAFNALSLAPALDPAQEGHRDEHRREHQG